jgi:O-antigen ligase
MATSERALSWTQSLRKTEPLAGAFFWLSMFYLVYCARPEDWIPGLKFVPLAKISGVFAFLGLLTSVGKSQRGLRAFPREARYLFLLVCLLFVSAVFSPVWRGGALIRTLDFAKVSLAWALTLIVVTTFQRLRRIIFIQAASVAVISVVSAVKGASAHNRLEGVLGGIYSNPNDLAFAIVLSLPFCFAFLLSTRSMARRAAWVICMLCMVTALFLTASRGGFITLAVAGTVSMWHFAIKGRRPQIIVAVLLVGVIMVAVAGGKLKDRFMAMSGAGLDSSFSTSAYGSYEERRYLMLRSLEGIAHYPVLGIGVRNFSTYSGIWKEVHVSYLQIAVEGGIPALILYLLFFSRGFTNLRQLKRIRDQDSQTKLFVGALHSSLVGFMVGALFSPEAYQYFPYFAVSYTAVLVLIAKEEGKIPVPTTDLNRLSRFGNTPDSGLGAGRKGSAREPGRELVT